MNPPLAWLISGVFSIFAAILSWFALPRDRDGSLWRGAFVLAGFLSRPAPDVSLQPCCRHNLRRLRPRRRNPHRNRPAAGNLSRALLRNFRFVAARRCYCDDGGVM